MKGHMDFDAIMEKARKLQREGKYEEAMKLYKEAEKIADTKSKRALVLRGFANIYLRKGQLFKARSYMSEAIKLGEETSDENLLTSLYTTSLEIHNTIGDFGACEKDIKMGLKYGNDSKPRTKFTFHNMVGIFNFYQGHVGRAKKEWEMCLEIAKEIGDTSLLAIAYNNMGEVYRIRGEQRKALNYYGEAYEQSKKMEDFRGMAINLLNMALIERENKNLEMAEKYLRESVELYDKHNNKEVAATSYAPLALALADEKRYEEAMSAAKTGIKLAEDVKSKAEVGECTMSLGYVYEMQEDYKKAMQTYNEAKRVLEEINNKVLLSQCELFIGRVLLKGNMKDAARFHLEKAKNIANEIGEFSVMQKANSLLAKC